MQETTSRAAARSFTYILRGNGSALLMIHGLGGSARSFSQVIDQIAACGYRVFAINMPGYGGSEALPERFPAVQAAADDVASVLDALEVARCDVLGHSLGGVLASTLAHYHPDRVKRLVLSSPPRGGGLGEPATWPTETTKRLADFTAEGPELYAKKRAPALCAANASPETVAAVEREMRRLTLEGLSNATSLYARADLVSLLKDSGHVTQFLAADSDRTVPREAVQASADALGKRVTLIAGAGHAAYAETPAAFVKAAVAGLRTGV